MTDISQLITDNIEVWMNAIIPRYSSGKGSKSKHSLLGIQNLRGLILDLAIQGKLTQQDASEEDAGQVLSRIKLKKEELIKNKVIKKSKESFQVSDFNKSLDLPKNWRLETLGNLSTLITDGAHKTPKYIDSGVPFISVKDIDGKNVIFDDCKYISKEEHDLINSRCNPEFGDVLICRIGTLGRVTLVDTNKPFSLFVSVGLIKFFQEEYLPKFTHLVMHSPFLQRQYEKIKAGGSHTNKLNLRDLPKLVLPVAPINEQKRVIAKVEKLMALCDQLEQQTEVSIDAHQLLVEELLSTLTNSENAQEFEQNWARIAEHFDLLFTTEHSIEQLKQTILQLAVMGKLVQQDPTDEPASELLKRIAQEKEQLVKDKVIKKQKALPLINDDEKAFDLPESWEWTRFDNIVDQRFPISYGVLVPGPHIDNGIPLVRIGDIDITNPPYLPEKKISSLIDEKYERTRLEGGEILMAVVGSIGKLGIVPKSWKGANIARALCRIKPLLNVNKEYVLLLLQSKFMQESFAGDTRTVAQPTLNVGLIRNAMTPIPPEEEQTRIVIKTNELLDLCDQLSFSLNAISLSKAQLAEAIVEQALN